MTKVEDRSKTGSKRERRRAGSEAQALARKRQALRRRVGFTLAGLALVAVAAVGSLALLSGDESGGGATSVVPARPGEVTVSGPARTAPLVRGEAFPSFSAPGFRVVSDPGTGDPSIRREAVEWSPGQPTVISVWAPWCPHCQVELPVLDRVMDAYPDVAFLTVVTSIGSSPGPDAGAFMADHGIAAPTAIDDTRGALAAALGIRGFPTLYFVGSDGTVSSQAEGEVDEDGLRRMLDSLT